MNISQLPFFYKTHPSSDNGGCPHVLPFEIFFDVELKMFRQRPSSELEKILKKVYEEGSLVDGSISSESGKVYIPYLIDYILSHSPSDCENVLEVGCGTGLMLKKLRESKASNFFGIEPGNHPRVDGLERIEIIRDFFPSPQLKRKFNLIYSFCVLEHLQDPLTFIEDTINHLSEDGVLIFGVPNCESFLKDGDLSVFYHEHFSYFTKQSIVAISQKLGLNVLDITEIKGMLVFAFSSKKNDLANIQFDVFSEDDFFKKAYSHFNSLKQLLSRFSSCDIAVYIPGRALNTFFQLGLKDIRLVDDNSEMHGRYLPYFSKPVSDINNLLLNPPKLLLIYSRTFGKAIKDKCLSFDQLKNTTIVGIDEL